MSDLFQQERDRVALAVAKNVPNGREEIALLAPEGCIGVECGVDTGQLSKRMLDLNHLGILHSVDKWDDHAHSRFEYMAVAELLNGYERSKVWHMSAQEFARIIPDQSLGFVYMDCYAHTGQDDGAVLEAMWPKLHPGGIFSGDDYDKKVFPKTWGAVNQFAEKYGCEIQIRDEFNKSAGSFLDGHPTWWIRK